MTAKTYTDRSNCAAAAKAALIKAGIAAPKRGVDFEIIGLVKPDAPTTYTWKPLGGSATPIVAALREIVSDKPAKQHAMNPQSKAFKAVPADALEIPAGMKRVETSANKKAIAGMKAERTTGRKWAEPRQIEAARGKLVDAPAARKAIEAVTGGQTRVRKSTAEAATNAAAGIMPKAPDFSAETHKRFRPKLAELIALAKAGDVKGLKAYAINPISTSPKAMDRYRNLCVIALEAKAAPKAKKAA